MANDTLTVRCENCGATFSAGTKTCRTCGATLPTFEKQQEDEMLEGMPLSDWREFIGPRSNNYIEIFKKHEGKAIFLSFNPWPLLFGLYWMFYRKMYKLAFALLAVSLVIVTFVASLVCAAYVPELKKAGNALLAYSEYIDVDGKKTSAFPNDEDEAEKIMSVYYNYKDTVNKISTKATLVSTLVQLPVMHLLVYFLSFFFYREHVLNRTIRRKGYVASSGEGGVSFGAVILYYLFGNTVTALASIIPTITIATVLLIGMA